MRPVIIINDEADVPVKSRTITIYKQELFEDMDAESYKFSEIRPDIPSHRSDILANGVSIQEKPYTLTKERTITIYKQKLYEDIDAETYKYSEARPDANPQATNASGSDSAERLDGHILARLV